MRMKRFMAMLNKNKNKDPPPSKLLDLAGKLCRDLQSSPPSLEKLVGAVLGCKHRMYFLTNIHVVRACVSVHIRNGQHDRACSLLERCKAEEKEELVQLWHEVHYQRVMERQHKDFLTPVQRFRCRKRNPPPISLCPEGLKNRNYPEEVRQHLHRFAVEVTANPDKKQRHIEFTAFENTIGCIDVCMDLPSLDRDTFVIEEGLARDMNLQPVQVYNWFANYRRRRKPCVLPTETLPSSCPERAWTSHTQEEQSKGSYSPQTAGGSHAGTGSEQMEITLVPCEPRWEQSAADLDKPPRGTYLEMLESSFLQSTELLEAGTSTALFSVPSTEQPAPFCSEAVLEPGPCFRPAVLQPRAAVSSAGASPQLGSLVLCSCRPLPVLDEGLAVWQSPCSTTGVSGSVWTPGIEGIRVPLSRVPQGGCIEGSPGGIIQQSDLEVESFILREGQLGTLEAIPHSSCQTVFGKPQCPPVSAPCMEESQALGQSQSTPNAQRKELSPITLSPAALSQEVLQDPVGDPLSSDTFWAACLLFEFSASGQM